MSANFCEATSKSTGKGCQQPERWLEIGPGGERRKVCQQHGRMLERQGWVFERELYPVPGFERIAEAAHAPADDDILFAGTVGEFLDAVEAS